MKKIICALTILAAAAGFTFAADSRNNEGDAGFTLAFGIANNYESNRYDDSSDKTSGTDFLGELGLSVFTNTTDTALQASVFIGAGLQKGTISMNDGFAIEKVGDSYLSVTDDADIWNVYARLGIGLESRLNFLSLGLALGPKIGVEHFNTEGINQLLEKAEWTRNSIYIDIPFEPYAAVTLGKTGRISASMSWDLPFVRINSDSYSKLDKDYDFGIKFFSKPDIQPVIKISYTHFIQH